MNANEISLKINPRLKRIQKISTFFRTLFFVSALLFVPVGIMLIKEVLTYNVSDLRRNPLYFWTALFSGVNFILWTVETWFAYKLFFFYAQGNLFTAEIVRHIQRIGYITILIGLWNIFKGLFLFNVPTVIPAGIQPTLAGLGIITMQLIFCIIPGFVIIFIAWIMDEGRKFQEEQELTV